MVEVFFFKSEIAIKNFILRLWVILFCISLEIATSGDFSNIYKFSTKDGIALGHLHRYNSLSFRENFPEFCVMT